MKQIQKQLPSTEKQFLSYMDVAFSQTLARVRSRILSLENNELSSLPESLGNLSGLVFFGRSSFSSHGLGRLRFCNTFSW